MENLQTLDPRKQELLEARILGNRVSFFVKPLCAACKTLDCVNIRRKKWCGEWKSVGGWVAIANDLFVAWWTFVFSYEQCDRGSATVRIITIKFLNAAVELSTLFWPTSNEMRCQLPFIKELSHLIDFSENNKYSCFQECIQVELIELWSIKKDRKTLIKQILQHCDWISLFIFFSRLQGLKS